MNDPGFSAHMEEVRRRFCPSEDEMSSYSRGHLNPKRMEEIREHLTTCELCEEMLDDVKAFFTGDANDLSRDLINEDFARVWSQADHVRELSTVQPVAPQRFRLEPRYLAVAASLLIAIAGVWWSVRSRQGLQEDVRALNRAVEGLRSKLQADGRAAPPRTEVRLVELFPADTYTRNERQSNVAQVPAPEGSELVLVMNGQAMADCPAYSVELFDGQERLRWRSDNVRRATMGNFVISMPAAYLEPGRYRIVVTGGATTKEYDFGILSLKSL